MIFTLNAGDESSITQPITISTVAPIKINSITLNGVNAHQTLKGSVTLQITDSTDNTNRYTKTLEVNESDSFSKQGNDVTFNPDFSTSNENAVITLTVSTSQSTIVYGGVTRSEESLLQGLGAKITSASMFNCTLDAELVEGVWHIGSSGYAELYANPYNPWEDWERDEEDYPLNVSVWRIDNRNKGFPFIITDEAKISGNSVLIFTENSLITGQSMVFTADSLEPVMIVPISTLGQ